jgi:hypothetical protein
LQNERHRRRKGWAILLSEKASCLSRHWGAGGCFACNMCTRHTTHDTPTHISPSPTPITTNSDSCSIQYVKDCTGACSSLLKLLPARLPSQLRNFSTSLARHDHAAEGSTMTSNDGGGQQALYSTSPWPQSPHQSRWRWLPIRPENFRSV